MSPRSGHDGKRAEKGPSVALAGGLEAGDAAPRTCSVVLVLLSARWRSAVSVGCGLDGVMGTAGDQMPSAWMALVSAASDGAERAAQASADQISTRWMRPVTTTSEPRPAYDRSRAGTTIRPC